MKDSTIKDLEQASEKLEEGKKLFEEGKAMQRDANETFAKAKKRNVLAGIAEENSDLILKTARTERSASEQDMSQREGEMLDKLNTLSKGNARLKKLELDFVKERNTKNADLTRREQQLKEALQSYGDKKNKLENIRRLIADL